MEYKNVMKKQEEMITLFQEQHAADQRLIDTQEETIRVQGEKIVILEKEIQKLKEAGDQLAAASVKLEKICARQQELIDSMSEMSHSSPKPTL